MVLKKVVVIGLLVILLLVLSLNSFAAVLINEILANGIDDPNSEWIELFNDATSDVNLTNWKVSETASSNFTLNAIIKANSFIILASDYNTFNSVYPNVNLSGIKIINITISNFNLADTSGEVKLYNSSEDLVDVIAYVQASGKTFENVSIGRYPDGSINIFNLSTLTPGAKNDAQAPRLNKWINPARNNTRISALTNIIANITDDTTQVNSTIINFNGTNFSMTKTNGLWSFLWNTSLNTQKAYNITIFFNDSYGKIGFDKLFNITVSNSPVINSFFPSNLTQTLEEGFTLEFSINASDPDDKSLNFFWFIDSSLNSTNTESFSYTPTFNDNGTHTINATVRDATSNQASIKWVIIVRNVNRAPVLGSISNKTVTKNIDLIFNVTASDLDNDTLTFSSNKSGIIISKVTNAIATVSWRATNKDLGNNMINFTVSDGIEIDSEIISIEVDAKNNTAPEIISKPKITATINERYIYDFDAIDSDNDVLVYSIMADTSGISIDSSNGAVTFTPLFFGLFDINVSVSDLVEIINQSYNLTIIEGSKLKITDVDVKIDGKKSSNIENNTKISKEAGPGSKVEFKVKIKNEFSKSDNMKIENVQAKVTIEDMDEGDDLEEESNEFDLRSQNDKTVTLGFELPLNIEEDNFNVLIEVEGEAENGSFYEQHFKIELDVEKEKHELKFLNFEVTPTIINCNRILNVNYKIINIGEEDEESSILEIKNDVLGIDFREKDISIDAGTDDNIFSKSSKIKIDEKAESDTYHLIANIYSDDGKLDDTKMVELKVGDCIKIDKVREPEVVLITPSNEETKRTKATKEQIYQPTIKISFREGNNMVLLVLSTLIFTLFFVFIAIVVYVKY